MKPYLSIVMAACNHSDFDENERLTQCYHDLVVQAGRLELELEILVVQWNPPMAPRLNMVLTKPEPWPTCVVARFIDVPGEHHLALGLPPSHKQQRLQALNVGIRRARAPFILTMGLDSQLHPDVLRYFSEKQLLVDCVYRTANVIEFKQLENDGDSQPKADNNETPLLWESCEDFLLMPREVWFQQRGFAAIPRYSKYTAGLTLYGALSQGLEQVQLAGGLIRGQEERSDLDEDGLDFESGFLAWCLQFHEFGFEPVNGPNWGLGNLKLPEVEEDRLPHGFR